MKRFIGVIGVCSIIFLWSGNVVAVTIQDCEVTAAGDFVTGEVFVGTASDIAGVEMIDWLHTAPDILIETMVADPNGIECRQNGTVSADFIGTGTATFNEVAGHSYIIVIEDNRPGSDPIVLDASISHRPVVRTKGIADFDPPQTVVIPPFLTVTAGDSGRGIAKLRLDDINCIFRGTGPTYLIQHCGDPADSGFMAGDNVDIGHAELVILTADRSFDLTTVQVDIGTGDPPVGIPDFYEIHIFGSDGTEIYSFNDVVEDGDIAITLLGP